MAIGAAGAAAFFMAFFIAFFIAFMAAMVPTSREKHSPGNCDVEHVPILIIFLTGADTIIFILSITAGGD